MQTSWFLLNHHVDHGMFASRNGATTTSGYVDKLITAKNVHAGDLSKLCNIK